MKSSRFIARFFLIGLGLSVILFSPFILDFTLLPRFICLSIFIGLTIYFISRSALADHFTVDAVTGSYLLYCFFCCLSVLWAINKSEALFEAARIILSVLVFVLTYLMLKLQRNYFTELFQKFSILLFFILFAVVGYQFAKLENHDKASLYLVIGLNGHKNLLASFLFLNLFFLINAHRQLKAVWRATALFAIITTFIILIVLQTKAVWLGSIVFMGIYWVFSRITIQNTKSRFGRLPKLLVFLTVANVFFLCFLQPAIKAGIQNSTATDNKISFDQERLVIWDKTYDMIHKHPVVGVGAGNWQVNFPDATLSGLWRAEDLNYTFQRPHNDFLWVLAETGIIGLNLFLIFIFSLIFYFIKILKSTVMSEADKSEFCLCFSTISGYFIISFFDFPKERIEHIILLNVIFGIVYFHIKNNTLVRTFGTIQPKTVTYIFLIGLLIFIFTVGTLKYKGEYYTRKIYDYRNSKQQALLITAGESAISFGCTLDPTSMPIYWYMGNAEALIPNHQQNALEDFKKAYVLNPFNRNVINDLASAYSINNDNEMAKKYYREAARISPRFDDPKLNLVAIYIREKNYKMADEVIKTLFHDSERRTQYQRIIDAFQ